MYRVGANADASQIASAIVAIWIEIEAALVPVIGQRGLGALCRRSLYVASAGHPWLLEAAAGAATTLDLPLLKTVLARQDDCHATAGGAALLKTFHELLSSLIGPLLTERLLSAAWANSLHGTIAQDFIP